MPSASPSPVAVDPPTPYEGEEPLVTPPVTAFSALRALHTLYERLIVPAVGAGLVGILSGAPYEGAVLALMAFVATGLLVPPRRPWTSLLRFTRFALLALRPAAALAALALLAASTGVPELSLGQALIVLLAVTGLNAMPLVLDSRGLSAKPPMRTVVIGSDRSATEIARELRLASVAGYEIVGRVSYPGAVDGGSGEVPTLGPLENLSSIVERGGIGLLVMTAEVPRSVVFDEVARSCLHLPVRLWELTGFSEDVFGHVPVAEMNAAWFQYIMHPRYRPTAPGTKRALDVVVAILLAGAFLPVFAVLALLIRRDGGPVFFKQTRVGEGGAPLTVYKLRTMRVGSDSGRAQWASADDPRITRLGRILRLTHVDEFPQILNVLRGEMSLVGPRPEQPEFVERLEHRLPFYSRRHLVKPGLTGWAQVRCGYVGSDVGSAWKLCHDLYYLKHRSLGLDLAIMAETVRTLFGDRYNAVDSSTVSFIHGGRELVASETPDLVAAEASAHP